MLLRFVPLEPVVRVVPVVAAVGCCGIAMVVVFSLLSAFISDHDCIAGSTRRGSICDRRGESLRRSGSSGTVAEVVREGSKGSFEITPVVVKDLAKMFEVVGASTTPTRARKAAYCRRGHKPSQKHSGS